MKAAVNVAWSHFASLRKDLPREKYGKFKLSVMNIQTICLMVILQFLSVMESKAEFKNTQSSEKYDSINITFKVLNPYNRSRLTAGVIIKMELDKWDPVANKKVTDKNGIAQLRISRERLNEEILFFYTEKFQKSMYLPKLNNSKDTLIYIQLEYVDNSYLYSFTSNYKEQTKYFCSNLDSLSYQNCRFIDLNNNNITKLPFKLKKYRNSIEILIIDSNKIHTLPRYLIRKNRLRIMSFTNTNLSNPQIKFTKEETFYWGKEYKKNYFFTIGNNDIIYSAFFYE